MQIRIGGVYYVRDAPIPRPVKIDRHFEGGEYIATDLETSVTVIVNAADVVAMYDPATGKIHVD
jgi:hypothetical protein